MQEPVDSAPELATVAKETFEFSIVPWAGRKYEEWVRAWARRHPLDPGLVQVPNDVFAAFKKRTQGQRLTRQEAEGLGYPRVPGEQEMIRVRKELHTAVEGLSAHFVWLNRGKRSVVLDLRESRGREAFVALVDRADVLVHNQGPGAAERAGFAYADLQARNPRLIFCAISGYGPDGPHRDRKAYDLLLQGEAGAIALTGTPETPSKVGISIADIASGMYAFSSILAALHQRSATDAGT